MKEKIPQILDEAYREWWDYPGRPRTKEKTRKRRYRIKTDHNRFTQTTGDEYNKWRQSLPALCWNCDKFDRCYPKNKCMFNPNYKKVENE